MTVLQILKRARALIADKRRWCHGVLAIDKDGFPVDPNEATACRWCAVGALIKIAGDTSQTHLASHLLNDVCQDSMSVNDGPRGHYRILKAFDRAIAKAKAKRGGK